jgi:hypothetical protein
VLVLLYLYVTGNVVDILLLYEQKFVVLLMLFSASAPAHVSLIQVGSVMYTYVQRKYKYICVVYVCK